jgi:hypothetical protein
MTMANSKVELKYLLRLPHAMLPNTKMLIKIGAATQILRQYLGVSLR